VAIKVGGYTDSTGDAAANRRLSRERARTTMNALVALGVGQQRLEAEGYGEEHPVASNDTDEGRQRNRRIDLRVTHK
jgi:outer membrane protein OmpA-like peptidoglycan-associated protein